MKYLHFDVPNRVVIHGDLKSKNGIPTKSFLTRDYDWQHCLGSHTASHVGSTSLTLSTALLVLTNYQLLVIITQNLVKCEWPMHFTFSSMWEWLLGHFVYVSVNGYFFPTVLVAADNTVKVSWDAWETSTPYFTYMYVTMHHFCPADLWLWVFKTPWSAPRNQHPDKHQGLRHSKVDGSRGMHNLLGREGEGEPAIFITISSIFTIHFIEPYIVSYIMLIMFHFLLKVLQNKPISKQCDVYSYAIVVWELLTHKIPFEDITDSFQICWMVATNNEVNIYSYFYLPPTTVV